VINKKKIPAFFIPTKIHLHRNFVFEQNIIKCTA
jgi:hypothetical protein